MRETAVLQAAIEAQKAIRGSQQFVDATVKMSKGAKTAGKHVRSLDLKTEKLGSTAGKTKRLIAGLFVGLSATLVLRKAIGVITNYEETMATLKGVSKATADEFIRLEKTARLLGATTRFSAKEAGDALLFLARAGFSATQAMEAVPHTLNLAAAGMMDLGTAADIASNILSQFGLSTKQTERVVDTLINTANSANTNVLQLAEAMKMVGPVAGSLGLSIEQTSAAIGVLGDRGIQASIAGTNLRGVFSALLNPSDKVNATLKEMEVSFEDVNIASHDILTVFKAFEKANLSASQAVRIFGRRNAAAALILADSTKKLEILTQANKDAEGEARKMAEIMSDTLAGAFKNLKSAVEEAFLSLGDSGMKGSLRSLVDSITNTLRALLGLGYTLGEAQEKFERIAQVVRAVAIGFAAFMAALVVSKVLAMVHTIWLLVSAVGTLNATLVVSPITAVAMAIGAVAAAMTLLTSRTNEATQAIEKHSKVLNEAKQMIDRMEDASARLVMAIKVEDVQEQVNQYARMRSVLKDVAVELIKLQEAGKTETKLLTDWNLALLEAEIFTPEAQEGFYDPGMEYLTGVHDPLLDIEMLLGLIAGRMTELDELSKKAGKGIQDFEKGTNEVADLLDEMEGLVESYWKLQAVQKVATKTVEEMIAGQQQERDLIGMSNDERERTIMLKQALAILDEAGIRDKKKLINQLDWEIRRTQQVTKEEQAREAAVRKLQRLYESLGDTIARAFENAVFQTKSLKQAVHDLSTELARLVFRQIVTQPLASGISDVTKAIIAGLTPSASATDTGTTVIPKEFAGTAATMDEFLGIAKGAVFHDGALMRYADGGIVSAPTIFPMRRGVGLMGEAGPEAVMPLARGKDGKLGVKSSGGTTQNIHVTINTPDADSFRRSKGQVIRTLRDAAGRV